MVTMQNVFDPFCEINLAIRAWNLEMSVCAGRVHAWLSNMLVSRHNGAHHMQEITRAPFYIYRNWS